MPGIPVGRPVHGGGRGTSAAGTNATIISRASARVRAVPSSSVCDGQMARSASGLDHVGGATHHHGLVGPPGRGSHPPGSSWACRWYLGRRSRLAQHAPCRTSSAASTILAMGQAPTQRGRARCRPLLPGGGRQLVRAAFGRLGRRPRGPRLEGIRRGSARLRRSVGGVRRRSPGRPHRTQRTQPRGTRPSDPG
jgi:hypothetical protein